MTQRRISKGGFTLIELLVVIAIIAILAAILFPVFAKARSKARQTQCINDMKQVATGITQYCQDFDETLPHGGDRNGDNSAIGTSPDGRPLFNSWDWRYMIHPYIKNGGVFSCPEMIVPNEPIWAPDKCCTGVNLAWNVGIKRSYCGNYAWADSGLQPNGRRLADITRPASIILILEDVQEQPDRGPYAIADRCAWCSGNTGRPSITSHNGMTDLAFIDGHVKAMSACATVGNLNYNNGATPPDDQLWSWWQNNGGDWENPATMRGWQTTCKQILADQ